MPGAQIRNVYIHACSCLIGVLSFYSSGRVGLRKATEQLKVPFGGGEEGGSVAARIFAITDSIPGKSVGEAVQTITAEQIRSEVEVRDQSPSGPAVGTHNVSPVPRVLAAGPGRDMPRNVSLLAPDCYVDALVLVAERVVSY